MAKGKGNIQLPIEVLVCRDGDGDGFFVVEKGKVGELTGLIDDGAVVGRYRLVGDGVFHAYADYVENSK